MNDPLEAEINELLARDPPLPETNRILLELARRQLAVMRKDEERIELAKQALLASMKLTHELNEFFGSITNRRNHGTKE